MMVSDSQQTSILMGLGTKCDDGVIACPVEPTRCGAAHSKYCVKREHQCGEDVFYLKTETTTFTQNAYLLHFLEGHLSLLVSQTREPKAMYNSCKVNLKKKNM